MAARGANLLGTTGLPSEVALCSELRAGPAFQLSWQLWKWHDRPIQSRFVSSPTHRLSLQQLVITCGFKRKRQ
jgi:hypothetical protein